MTDWLALCRGAVEDVRGVLAELPSRAEREPVLARGQGGDDTTAIDAAAERAILARFAGVDATLLSEEAEAAVDCGEAEAALLVRPTPIEAVFERARRGEVLPQKTTYFFPKLTSGLLFYPLGD